MTRIIPYGASHSNILRCKSYADCTISETKYQPRESLDWHCHPNTAFVFVLDGCFDELSKQASFNCRPTDLLFRPKEQPHQNRFYQNGGRCLNVELSSRWLENNRTPLTNHQGTLHLRQPNLGFLARKLFQEFLLDDCFSSMAVEGLLLELVAQSGRMTDSVTGGKVPRWLALVCETLHSHFEEPITIASLANAANVHPTHMIRAFRKHFGCTIGEYVRRLRIDYACSQLLESQKCLAEIALDSGFADQSHFTVTFKHLVGITPRRYRCAGNARMIKKMLVPHKT